MHFLGTTNGKSTETLITVITTLMNRILPGMLSYSADKHSPSFVDIEIAFVIHKGQTPEITQQQPISDNTLINTITIRFIRRTFPRFTLRTIR
jgi:hypothetical protein